MRVLTWLDAKLRGLFLVRDASTEYPERAALKFTGTVTVTDDPSNGQTVVNVTGGGGIDLSDVDYKAPVAVVATSNVTLSGEQTIDGVLTSASRVLVQGNTTASQRGIWVTGSGAWTRATDMPVGSNASGVLVPVDLGGTYNETLWLCTTTAGSDVVGTDSLTFVVPIPFASVTTPADVAATGSAGSVAAYAKGDHAHAHGAQTDGTMHAAATTSVNGFMSATDKTKADAYPAISGLTTGQPLRATGASSSAFGALDLANTSAVTGLLPVGNRASPNESEVRAALGLSAGSVDVNSQKITGLATPTLSTDAVTKAYADAVPFSGTVVDLYANRPAGVTGKRFIPTDGGHEQIYDGSAWRPLLGNTLGNEPPAASTFPNARGTPTMTSLTKANGILTMQFTGLNPLSIGGYAGNMAAPTTASIECSAGIAGTSTSSSGQVDPGVWMRESGTNKALMLTIGQSTRSGNYSNVVGVQLWTNSTTRSTFQTTLAQPMDGKPMRGRLRVSGTNVLAEVSIDGGASWIQIYTIAKTSAFTTAADEYGPAVVQITQASSTLYVNYSHMVIQ